MRNLKSFASLYYTSVYIINYQYIALYICMQTHTHFRLYFSSRRFLLYDLEKEKNISKIMVMITMNEYANANLGAIVGFELLLERRVETTLARDDAQEFGRRVVRVERRVRVANADELFKVPAVRHGCQHLRQLVLVTLEHAVHVFGFVLVTPFRDAALEQLDQLCDVVKFRFLQNAYSEQH